MGFYLHPALVATHLPRQGFKSLANRESPLKWTKKVGMSIWEDWQELIGRVLIRIGKGELCLKVGFQSQSSVSRMTAYIKKCLSLPLTLEEEGLENALVGVGGEK